MLMNFVGIAVKQEGVWKGSKHYRSYVQVCNELSISIRKYFAYPTQNDHVKRFGQLSWKICIYMFRVIKEFLFLTWRGNGRLTAKRTVGCGYTSDQKGGWEGGLSLLLEINVKAPVVNHSQCLSHLYTQLIRWRLTTHT